MTDMQLLGVAFLSALLSRIIPGLALGRRVIVARNALGLLWTGAWVSALTLVYWFLYIGNPDNVPLVEFASIGIGGLLIDLLLADKGQGVKHEVDQRKR